MQKWLGTGIVVRDPDVRFTQGATPLCIASFTIAVRRRFKRDNEPDADFIPCKCFGKTAEFVEKYVKKGIKLECCGEVRTGSYTNKDGAKVYTTEIFVEEVGFAERSNQSNIADATGGKSNTNDFMMIPDGIDEELPFK